MLQFHISILSFLFQVISDLTAEDNAKKPRKERNGDKVRNSSPPPPLHAGPLPRAGRGRRTRSPSGAPPPPLHAGPLPRAGGDKIQFLNTNIL